MAIKRGPNLTTNNIILALDPKNNKSYIGTGNSINDISGNGNNGTLIDNPQFSNGVFSFDGTSWISTPISNSVNNLFADNTQSWSVNIWFKPNGVDGVICGNADGIDTDSTFALYMESSNLKSMIRGSETIISSNLLTTDFHCITVTWDQTQAFGYYNDNNSVELNVGTATIQNNNYGICDSAGGSLSNFNRFSGEVSANYLYSISLSETQAHNNYRSLSSRFGL
jgi:hypothetical protein